MTGTAAGRLTSVVSRRGPGRGVGATITVADGGTSSVDTFRASGTGARHVPNNQ